MKSPTPLHARQVAHLTSHVAALSTIESLCEVPRQRQGIRARTSLTLSKAKASPPYPSPHKSVQRSPLTCSNKHYENRVFQRRVRASLSLPNPNHLTLRSRAVLFANRPTVSHPLFTFSIAPRGRTALRLQPAYSRADPLVRIYVYTFCATRQRSSTSARLIPDLPPTRPLTAPGLRNPHISRSKHIVRYSFGPSYVLSRITRIDMVSRPKCDRDDACACRKAAEHMPGHRDR